LSDTGKQKQIQKKLNQGYSEGELTKKGLQQAGRLSEFLKPVIFDAIYTSDLKRTYKTAEKINIHHGDELCVTNKLRERNYGEFELKPRTEYLAFIKKHQKNNPSVSLEDIPLETGESLKQFKERILSFFKQIFKKHKKGQILFVTHGGIKKILLMHAINIPLDEYYKTYDSFKNCGVSIINYDDEKEPRVILQNHTDHLVGLDPIESDPGGVDEKN